MKKKLNGEWQNTVDYFICYLLSAREVMGDSEELIFHTPSYPSKDKVIDTFRKNEAVHNCWFSRPETWELPKYLNYLWERRFPVVGFDRTLEDIERSPINARVTLDMVMNKFRKYQEETMKSYSKKTARKIFLERNLNNP